MSTRTPLQQRRETVLDLYASGHTPASIGAEIDTPAKVVREILSHARKGDNPDPRAAHNRPEPFKWTDDLLATALRMKDAGATAQDIVDEIGGTRNVVIGKLYRMGQPIGRKPAEPPKPRRPTIVKATQKPVQAVRAVRAPVAPPAPVLRLVSVGKPIWALVADECRWPVSPDDADIHLFCAAPTARGESYCPSCRKLAYAPPGTKQRIGINPTAGRRFA